LIRLTIPDTGDAEIEAVTRVLRDGFLVQGARVREFEERVAAYLGVPHAVAVSSGTAALHLAVLALGLGPGDEVLVPDFTHPATGNVVELAGARPVLVDVDLETFNSGAGHFRAALTPRTRALLPVHLFGQPAEMGPILELARERGLKVVEDAACALGAEEQGRKCGTLSDAGCFSFHPRKVITTGEGGMVVTRDEATAERVRQLRNHGCVEAGDSRRFERAGFNYRLTELQGALGVAQMERLEPAIRRRAELADRYDKALAGVKDVRRPVRRDGTRPVWQSYVVLLQERIDRDRVRLRLREDGIETTLGTYSLSAQPRHSPPAAPLANSRRAFRQSLALPLHPRMSDRDVDQVAARLAAAVS